MRRRTKLVIVAGGAMAVVGAGALVRRRLGGHGPEASTPDDDALFTAYAPGGQYGYLMNGPIGRVLAKVMPMMEPGVYDAVAEMIDPRPDDELLDIGCGPGAFLATKGQHVRRVVGLDPSQTMLNEAKRRLADRLAAGTARLVIGSAAELPFGDGEFSAVTAIFAPVKHAEAFRVLRAGGRLVVADPDPRRSPSEPASAWGTRRWSEADHRRMAEDAGFTDVTIRYRGDPPLGGELLVSCRRPAASLRSEAADVGDQRELAGSAAPA